MESRLFELVRLLVCGYYSNVVALGNMSSVSHAYCERLALQNILDSLVTRAQAHGNLLVTADPAPGCVHCVGLASLIVARDNKHRLRIGYRLCSKILSHIIYLLL